MEVNEKLYLRVKLNLSYFEGEKTEEPTAKKRRDARKEGQVAKSAEIGTAFLFLASFSVIRIFAISIVTRLESIILQSVNLIKYYDVFLTESPGDDLNQKYFMYFASQVIMILMPIMLTIMLVGIIVNIAQVGWKPTTKVLKPKFSKLNPLKGFKRMFSAQALVEFLKSILKLLIISLVVFNVVSKEVNMLAQVPFMELSNSVAFFFDIIYRMGMTVGFTYIAIAVVDFGYNKYKHNKDLKMSKQEIKDEYKQSEGNPEIKGKIRQKMREASMRRMMQDVPTADVIITNPTHYAVAIRYKHNQDFAPVVVAMGVDHAAKRIREKAAEFNIEIVENKPLARALYATAEVGQPIPPDLYQSVAEILAFVYKLKNKI